MYLGAAPGVGKTFAMLDEGRRRAARGTDVVVALVETHGRPRTLEAIGDLEVVPRLQVPYRDTTLTEMDAAAVLARKPQLALVDELAHTAPDGHKRWLDVEALLAAGVDVLTTVNVQHLESVNDVVARITGVPQRETVPDAFVRAAEQVQLVDITPEALRRRMAHGNVYAADKVDAALGNYFRVGNLTALRELALLWLADQVDASMEKYRREQGIDASWETKERVVVALTGGAEGETLIRRAARVARRSASGGELLAVHVVRSDGVRQPVASGAELGVQRTLLESLGGTFHTVVGEDVPTAILDFARSQNATQVVLGASRRGAVSALFGSGTGRSVIRLSGSIDVHVVTHDLAPGRPGLPRLTGGLTRRRRVVGAGLGVVLLAVLTPLCAAFRTDLSLGSDLLLFLSAVVVVSVVGGFWPALATALVGSLLLNWYFTPPLHTFTIESGENLLALVVFIGVAAGVSRVVDVSARRNSEAVRAQAEAGALSVLAGDVLRADDAVPVLLKRVRETFQVTSVALQVRAGDAWSTSAGEGVAAGQETVVEAGDDARLVLTGRLLAAEDVRVLAAFASTLAVAVRQRELTAAARAAAPLAEADRLRTALLVAVGHDLRTPLAAATAAVSSLGADDVTWTPAQTSELVTTAAASLSRLGRVVEDLLDISRLQAGVVTVFPRALDLADVLSSVLDGVGPVAVDVDVEVPADLPQVLADPGLLERVVENLVSNALRHGQGHAGASPVLRASSFAGVVELRIVDHGPGIAAADRETVFRAFQKGGDRSGEGVGLGLAVARGFTTAMGGTVEAEDTPGGGLTMVVTLPAALVPAGADA